MIAILEDIAQNLAQEMESTGTITLNGSPFPKRFTTNPSPYAGLCGPAVAKGADMVKEAIPKSRVDKIKFPLPHPRQPLHVVALVTTPEGDYILDSTAKQYEDGAKLVYRAEEYPYNTSGGSVETIYNNL